MSITKNFKETKAVGKYLRLAPHKVRRVLDQIRGRKYQEALIILEFMPYKVCLHIKQILESAAANAQHNNGLNKNRLFVSTAFVDKGPVLKRFQPRAQGRAFPIHKPTCHITVNVAELQM